MRYWRYILGEPVSFMVADRASVPQVVTRLKARMGSRFWPFHFNRMVGLIWGERLSIEWVPRFPHFRTNMEPRMTGRLVSAAAGVRFDGRFGAPFYLRIFLAIWACFGAVFSFLIVIDGGTLLPGAFILLWTIGPFAMAYVAARKADQLSEQITEFIVDVGSGREVL